MRLTSLLVAAGVSVASIAAAQPSQVQPVQLDPVLLSYAHSIRSAHPDEGKLVQNTQRLRQIRLWNTVVGHNWVIAYKELQRREAVRARDRVTAVRSSSQRHVSSARSSGLPASQGSGACGGNLPPCYVMMRESRGSLTAKNPNSTASGKWQFLDSTWAGYGGYAHASDAPESVQDARAAQVWAGGSGCSNWSAC